MVAGGKVLKDPYNNSVDGPQDFMSKFLTAHSADPEKTTKYDISMISASNTGAGSDTTAITLSHLLLPPQNSIHLPLPTIRDRRCRQRRQNFGPRDLQRGTKPLPPSSNQRSTPNAPRYRPPPGPLRSILRRRLSSTSLFSSYHRRHQSLGSTPQSISLRPGRGPLAAGALARNRRVGSRRRDREVFHGVWLGQSDMQRQEYFSAGDE
jgi:hypothetical protein